MRHRVKIAVSAIALFVLIAPLDCFALGAAAGRSTLKCGMKGQCAPSAKADDCCRAAVPVCGQPVVLQVSGSSPLRAVLVTACLPGFIPTLGFEARCDTLHHPPPLNPARYTRPLLI